MNDHRTTPGIWRRARNRARAATHRGDERGGAISLWVVLMVPVSAFAAVVAMAGPQRLAAESSMQDAADDLADFAVAWRDGHNTPTGELRAFPLDCAARTEQQDTDLALLEGNIAALDPTDPDFAAQLAEQDGLLNAQLVLFGMEVPLVPPLDEVELRERFDALVVWLDEWEAACDFLSDALVRDLGYLGVDMGSLRGFYSDSLTESPLTGSCSDSQYTTEDACTDASETWTLDPNSLFYVPCRTSEETVVRDAVHVTLAADWQDAGWAAAQVWPDGLPMAVESIGRLSQRDPLTTALECGQQLVVLDNQGQPVWAGSGGPTPDSRELAQSVGRTPLSG